MIRHATYVGTARVVSTGAVQLVVKITDGPDAGRVVHVDLAAGEPAYIAGVLADYAARPLEPASTGTEQTADLGEHR